MTHIGQIAIEMFFNAVDKSWEDGSVVLGKPFNMSVGFYEIGSILDSGQLCFDQRPVALGTLGLEITYFMVETALMLTTGENGSGGCYNPWASVGNHREGMHRVQPSADQLDKRRLLGFLVLPVCLDESKMLPLSLLSGSYSRQGRLPTDPLVSHFEVGPVNDEISELLVNGPVQLLNQLLLDALIHPAHIGRTHIAAPELTGDPTYLVYGGPLEKHFRDDLVNPLVLSAVAAQNGAVGRSAFPPPGQPQILNETKVDFELPRPRPNVAVFSQGSSLIKLGTREFNYAKLFMTLSITRTFV